MTLKLSGLMKLTKCAQKLPQAPAIDAATPNATILSFRASTPTLAAPSSSSRIARIARPKADSIMWITTTTDTIEDREDQVVVTDTVDLDA